MLLALKDHAERASYMQNDVQFVTYNFHRLVEGLSQQSFQESLLLVDRSRDLNTSVVANYGAPFEQKQKRNQGERER